jgi:hypothetical protein
MAAVYKLESIDCQALKGMSVCDKGWDPGRFVVMIRVACCVFSQRSSVNERLRGIDLFPKMGALEIPDSRPISVVLM